MAGNEQRWKQAAQALELGVPEERIEAVAPILDDLMARIRNALDRDLSLVEPVTVFGPKRERGGEG